MGSELAFDGEAEEEHTFYRDGGNSCVPARGSFSSQTLCSEDCGSRERETNHPARKWGLIEHSSTLSQGKEYFSKTECLITKDALSEDVDEVN